MFRSLDRAAEPAVPVTVDGAPALAHAGETVLALLLRLNKLPLRATPRRSQPRGPYCAMGVCYDCLVEIDDLGLRPSCLLPVRPGMAIRRRLEAL